VLKSALVDKQLLVVESTDDANATLRWSALTGEASAARERAVRRASLIRREQLLKAGEDKFVRAAAPPGIVYRVGNSVGLFTDDGLQLWRSTPCVLSCEGTDLAGLVADGTALRLLTQRHSPSQVSFVIQRRLTFDALCCSRGRKARSRRLGAPSLSSPPLANAHRLRYSQMKPNDFARLEDCRTDKKCLKLVLLGSGESGKRTIFLQSRYSFVVSLRAARAFPKQAQLMYTCVRCSRSRSRAKSGRTASVC
jgi:hypothetical protein